MVVNHGKPSNFPWADHVFPTKSLALFGKYPLLLIACIVDHSSFIKVKSRCYPMLFKKIASLFSIKDSPSSFQFPNFYCLNNHFFALNNLVAWPMFAGEDTVFLLHSRIHRHPSDNPQALPLSNRRPTHEMTICGIEMDETLPSRDNSQ